MECLIENDGIDHINVYSKGRTRLGRLLSNFAWTPFDHPEYGYFKTVEGFWYWIITGKDEFRYLPGYKCKEKGKKEINIREYPNKEELKIAYKYKLQFNPEIYDLLKENKLPFEHYYVYGNKKIKAIEWEWTAKLWN